VLVDLTTGIYSSSNGTIQAYVSPNPVDEETSLFYNLNSSQTVRIKIYNVNGQIVSDQSVDGIAGGNKCQIRRTDNLSTSGVYFISIYSNETSVIVPLLLK
jgi:Secretion system C-terminal sorting domain